jgi:hypothetical protein
VVITIKRWKSWSWGVSLRRLLNSPREATFSAKVVALERGLRATVIAVIWLSPILAMTRCTFGRYSLAGEDS